MPTRETAPMAPRAVRLLCLVLVGREQEQTIKCQTRGQLENIVLIYTGSLQVLGYFRR